MEGSLAQCHRLTWPQSWAKPPGTPPPATEAGRGRAAGPGKCSEIPGLLGAPPTGRATRLTQKDMEGPAGCWAQGRLRSGGEGPVAQRFLFLSSL